MQEKKNQPDQLFSERNSYRLNIKITVIINPSKFQGTRITQNNIETKFFTHHQDKKLAFASAVSRNYKKNAIVVELYRASKLSSKLK